MHAQNGNVQNGERERLLRFSVWYLTAALLYMLGDALWYKAYHLMEPEACPAGGDVRVNNAARMVQPVSTAAAAAAESLAENESVICKLYQRLQEDSTLWIIFQLRWIPRVVMLHVACAHALAIWGNLLTRQVYDAMVGCYTSCGTMHVVLEHMWSNRVGDARTEQDIMGTPLMVSASVLIMATSFYYQWALTTEEERRSRRIAHNN